MLITDDNELHLIIGLISFDFITHLLENCISHCLHFYKSRDFKATYCILVCFKKNSNSYDFPL